MTDKEKTESLLELMDALCSATFSQDEEQVVGWIQRLNKIYANGFRHNYADLFFKLQEILAEDAEVATSLGENINVLEEKIASKLERNTDDANIQNTANRFRKFADHIRLEIGRYNFIKSQFVKDPGTTQTTPNADSAQSTITIDVVSKVNDLSNAVDKMRPIAIQAQKGLDNLDAKLENNKISSITTLTIFSAVVLAFSGGITFEAGMLQGMASASPYRLVFTIALTGFILFNTIFALLYLVGKLAGKTISTHCKYMSHEVSNGQCQKCSDGYCTKPLNTVSIICRIQHKYAYVFFVNVTLLWIMYADYILWVNRYNDLRLRVVLCILIPAALIIVACIIAYVYKCVCRHRIKVACRIRVVKDAITPEEPSTSFFSTISLALNKVIGVNKKSLSELYLEFVAGEKADTKANFRKLLKRTDLFVEKYMLTINEMATAVSGEQHRRNKIIWKDLKEQLKDYFDVGVTEADNV